MRRSAPWLILLSAVVIAALLLALLGAPDTGGPLRPPAPTTRAHRPGDRPRPTRAADPGAGLPDDEGDDPVVDLPPEPFDLDRTYDLEHGFAEALVARTDRLAACWAAYVGRAAEPPSGRFTVELTVKGDGTRAEVAAGVVNEDVDDELEDCVARAMADARFEPVTGVHRFVMPVPIPP